MFQLIFHKNIHNYSIVGSCVNYLIVIFLQYHQCFISVSLASDGSVINYKQCSYFDCSTLDVSCFIKMSASLVSKRAILTEITLTS